VAMDQTENVNTLSDILLVLEGRHMKQRLRSAARIAGALLVIPTTWLSRDCGVGRPKYRRARMLCLVACFSTVGTLMVPATAHADTIPSVWSAYTRTQLFGCSKTQAVGNLYHQICLTRDITTSRFRALLIVTITSGPSHWVAVPGITSIMNTKPDTYRSCPTKFFPPGLSLACFSDPRYYLYGAWVQGQGRMDHDGISGNKYYSPTLQLND